MLRNISKISLIIFFLLDFGLSATTQENLVPNPSFEDVIQCPFSFGLETYTSDWKSARETPDYFNSCATWSGASVPSNDYDYQQPFTGSGYIGMITYRTDSSIYTEAASIQLSSPLTIGLNYYVSFRMSLTPEFDVAWATHNKLGIQFSTVEYNQSNPIPINNFAHIWTDSIITDTVSWMTVESSFIADSSYTFLNLGNFFDKSSVDTVIMHGEEINLLGAYYFFDEVCVSTDSTICYQSVGLSEYNDELKEFSVYPNPFLNLITIQGVKPADSNEYDVSIYNYLGQLICHEEYLTEDITINTSKFNSGFYMLRITSKNENSTYKLLKQ